MLAFTVALSTGPSPLFRLSWISMLLPVLIKGNQQIISRIKLVSISIAVIHSFLFIEKNKNVQSSFPKVGSAIY